LDWLHYIACQIIQRNIQFDPVAIEGIVY
jgi:hypothetical protein